MPAEALSETTTPFVESALALAARLGEMFKPMPQNSPLRHDILNALATEFSDEESGEEGGEKSDKELSSRLLKAEELCDLLGVSLPSVQRAQKTEKKTNLLMSIKYPAGVQRKRLKEEAVNLVDKVLEDHTDTLSGSSRRVCRVSKQLLQQEYEQCCIERKLKPVSSETFSARINSQGVNFTHPQTWCDYCHDFEELSHQHEGSLEEETCLAICIEHQHIQDVQ